MHKVTYVMLKAPLPCSTLRAQRHYSRGYRAMKPYNASHIHGCTHLPECDSASWNHSTIACTRATLTHNTACVCVYVCVFKTRHGTSAQLNGKNQPIISVAQYSVQQHATAGFSVREMWCGSTQVSVASHQALNPVPEPVNPQHGSSSANNVSAAGWGGQATEPGANLLQREGSRCRSSCGSVQSTKCQHWFLSWGGLAVHRWKRHQLRVMEWITYSSWLSLAGLHGR